MANELFSRKEVANIFGVHSLTIRDWEKAGKIKPSLYVGVRPRYTIEEINKVATEKPVITSKPPSNE